MKMKTWGENETWGKEEKSRKKRGKMANDIEHMGKIGDKKGLERGG